MACSSMVMISGGVGGCRRSPRVEPQVWEEFDAMAVEVDFGEAGEGMVAGAPVLVDDVAEPVEGVRLGLPAGPRSRRPSTEHMPKCPQGAGRYRCRRSR